MEKKTLFAALALLLFSGANAQQIQSHVAPSGQTLYYRCYTDLNDNQKVAVLTFPGTEVSDNSLWGGYEMPTGALIIPDSVEDVFYGGNVPVRVIRSNAFKNCTDLTSVVIPNTVKAIGDAAFYMCSGLTSVTMPDSLSSVNLYQWNGSFVDNAIAPFTFFGCFQLSGNITIPNGVTTISDHAFTSTNISSITWPTTVTTIGGFAFACCYSLDSVTIPNSVTTIEGAAFYYCYKTETINVPSSVQLVDYTYYWNGMEYPASTTFYGCKNINYTGSLIDSNNTLGASAWGARTLNGFVEDGYVYRDQSKTTITACNYNQTSVTLPSSVDTIGPYAFLWHEELTQIVMPEGLAFIGEGAFNSCIGLTEIDIPSTTNTIDEYAFCYCSGLNDVTLPAALTNLYYGVFSGCELDTLRMLGNVPPLYDNRYVGEVSTTTGDTIWYYDETLVDVPIVVPCHAGYAYRHADGWSACNNIIDPCGDEVVTYTVSVVSADETMGTVSTGGEVEEGDSFTFRAIANDGYHFLRWNDNDTNTERTVVITSDTTFTAYFEANSTEGIVTYTVSVVSADETMGTVSTGGEVEEGDSFAFRAIANDGYHFLRWNDNDTNTERTVVITSDTTFTAYFEANNTEGIGDVDGMNAKVYSANGQVVVENASGNPVTLYDATGRIMKTRQSSTRTTTFDVPSSGTYLVKVGNLPTRRVVVVR